MSWMDSWSRPNKSSATPPPLYLTSDDVKYCAACGRVIGDRRSHQKNKVVKYCSDGCRKRRLGPVDKKIDKAILALLSGQKDSGIEKIDVKSRFRKGDQRITIFCDEIEDVVFQRTKPEQAADEAAEQPQDDIVDANEHAEDPYAERDSELENSQGNRPNPVGHGSDSKRQEGQKRADEREAVRRAARRAVVFGFPVDVAAGKAAATKDKVEMHHDGSSDEIPRRKCEAVMTGQVVEPSYAKGNWAIRWRE